MPALLLSASDHLNPNKSFNGASGRRSPGAVYPRTNKRKFVMSHILKKETVVMFHKVMIVLALAAFVGGAFIPEAQAFGDKNGRAEFGNTHIGGAFAFAGYPDPHHHVSQGSRIGSVHVD